MLDPGKLRGCIDTGGRLDDRSIARELARIAEEIRALDEERRQLIDRYAAEQMAGDVYITANRSLDRDLERLTREKAELVAALRYRCMRILWTRAYGSSARARTRAYRRARTPTPSGSSSWVTPTRRSTTATRSRSRARSRCNRHRGQPSCNFGSRPISTRRRCAQGCKAIRPEMGAGKQRWIARCT